MTIETKFNLGDTVFVLEKEKVVRKEIYNAGVTIDKHGKIAVSYNWYSTGYTLPEKLCYPTKEALLQSL